MFQSFRHHHPRQYPAPGNETTHYQIFRERFTDVVTNNLQTSPTFTVGINKFSDWAPYELEVLRSNRPPSSTARTKLIAMHSFGTQQTSSSSKRTNAPTSTTSTTFDYTTRVSALNSSTHIIGPLRDQGQCGSCYGFAIIALFEAQYAFHYGLPVNMSDQQIVDCSTHDYGCIGGYFDTSFDYVKSYDWYIDSNLTYPYKGVASTCSAKKSGGYSIGNLIYRHLTQGNASAMQDTLVNYSPLWMSLFEPNAANKIMTTFQSYTDDIFQASGCTTSANNNNHAMVIGDSWGDEWGENSYVRIARGVNMCNVESDAFLTAKPAS
ncbi:unnamed protein product [Rotaria socialis]|uniref:Peptidase C1A papain C-terminal domain-containing protein n=1 Tax=Rotaria socialis TaxID=392032 RepID=A0A819VDH6_9BILA|nr:unnamed protein product [Rotaria socialis]CAF4107175.1 unnamed protein product [Rotaria socialis]